MKAWKSDKKIIRAAYNNNRINIVIAIIFLFGISIVFRLYNLQVKEYDFYVAKATSQHNVFSILEPERGRIFIQDDVNGNNDKLYPIATNKDFALVYAVPKDIKNPEKVAEELYKIFKKEDVIKEVDELMRKEDEGRLKRELTFLASQNLPANEMLAKEEEVTAIHEAIIQDSEYLEVKNIKREKEIELRKEIKISEYLKKLTKKNDPYEPIEQKVDEEKLKKLYVALMDTLPQPSLWQGEEVNMEDLEIKEDKVLYNKENGEQTELRPDGIAFISRLRRYYPENNIGSHVLGFVGFKGDEERGRYGLEGFFDEELYGVRGSIKTGRGAGGSLIIINDREYESPRNGSDLILTINRNIQFTACQKLNETALRHGADGGSIIIMEPKTGAILAMCSWPDYDPNNYKDVEDIRVYNNPSIFSEYEPGSIFKPITMAAAIDQEKVTPETTYFDEGSIMVSGWDKPIRNSDYDSHGGHGEVDMNYVLEKSLNTGAIYAMQQIGPEVFSQYVQDFGFGEKWGIELETESAGNINNLLGDKVQDIYAATASFGQGIATTPLQMITAYATIANGGIMMKPYLVKEITHFDNTKDVTQPKQIRRIISERSAMLLSGMLVNVIEGGHAKRAGVEGYYVAGKTGTAQVASQEKKGYGDKTIHTFVGFAPVEEPKFVMLVKLDNPKGIKYAASSAAPLFGEIAEYLLNYLEVPKER